MGGCSCAEFCATEASNIAWVTQPSTTQPRAAKPATLGDCQGRGSMQHARGSSGGGKGSNNEKETKAPMVDATPEALLMSVLGWVGAKWRKRRDSPTDTPVS